MVNVVRTKESAQVTSRYVIFTVAFEEANNLPFMINVLNTALRNNTYFECEARLMILVDMIQNKR